MMKLLLIRHGETDWNATKRYQGQSDIPLNGTGLQQAAQLAKRLSTEKIDVIYSSDLSRAVTTANAIGDLQPRPVIIQKDPRWRELSFGEWEGLNYDKVRAKWSGESSSWYDNPARLSPPGGETLMQLSARVESALQDLRNQHKDQTVLVVTHAGVIQALLCSVLGMDLQRYWQFRVLQTSITALDIYEDSAMLNLFNDVSHLREK